jgi:hypothetical protein
MATNSRRLVIDASVARASGQTVHPASRRCREFLSAVLKICHRAAITRELAAEWDKHQSQFARIWRAEMRSRGKIVDLPDVTDEEFRGQVDLDSPGVRKDLHLIEAALATDKLIVSLDERARIRFTIEATADIVWVNAVAVGGHAVYWLKSGAKPLKKWKLGYGR